MKLDESSFYRQQEMAAHKKCDELQAQLAERGKTILEQQARTGSVYGIIDPDYGRVFSIARAIAWQEGYSICAQGSFTRDLDLLATPWTNQARKDVDVLVNRIAQAADLNIQGDQSDKPHGRKAWTLRFKTFGDPRFIDISVMPPQTALEAALKAERIKTLEDAANRFITSGTVDKYAEQILRRMANELKEKM